MTEVTFPPSHQSSEAHLSSRWLNRPKITVLRAHKKNGKVDAKLEQQNVKLLCYRYGFQKEALKTLKHHIYMKM